MTSSELATHFPVPERDGREDERQQLGDEVEDTGEDGDLVQSDQSQLTQQRLRGVACRHR